MTCYDLFMAPFERVFLARARRALISNAYGKVLELGTKTGANFQYYLMEQIDSLTATDLVLDPGIYRHANKGVSFRECSAEDIPYPDATFDTVVETLILCSVTSVPKAVAEIRRVLKPGGIFLYLDHGLPVSPSLARLFHAVNRVWSHLTGGCNLNRRTEQQIESAGFVLEQHGSDGQLVFRWGVARKPLSYEE